MSAPIQLHVLVEDQAAVAAALLAVAGPDRVHEVQAQTGGFLAPADIVAAAGLIPSDDTGDVKAGKKPAAKDAAGA